MLAILVVANLAGVGLPEDDGGWPGVVPEAPGGDGGAVEVWVESFGLTGRKDGGALAP